MIFDSDVMIWYLQNQPRAIAILDATPDRSISIVTYMEVMQGARRKNEAALFKSSLVDLGFAVIPLSESIGTRAADYIDEHALKSGLRLADALVAATAVERRLELCSANRRHYRPIRDLRLRMFRP